MAVLAEGCCHAVPGISGAGSCVETAACEGNVDDCASWLMGTRRLCSSCWARVANRFAAGDCVRAFPAGAVVIANGLIIAATVATYTIKSTGTFNENAEINLIILSRLLSNPPKWVPLQWITHLNGYRLLEPV